MLVSPTAAVRPASQVISGEEWTQGRRGVGEEVKKGKREPGGDSADPGFVPCAATEVVRDFWGVCEVECVSVMQRVYLLTGRKYFCILGCREIPI
jgi:hypothetical protein